MMPARRVVVVCGAAAEHHRPGYLLALQVKLKASLRANELDHGAKEKEKFLVIIWAGRSSCH